MLRRKYPYQSSRHKALALCVTFAFELVGGVRLADEHDRVGKGLDIKAGRVCIDREALGLGKVGEACQLAYERGNELFEKKVSDAELVESSADEGFTVWDHHPPGHVFNGSYSNNTTEGDLDELKCRDGELCHAVENDFFGLHDLLLVGWSTPFVHDPLFSDGAYQIRDLVLRLIEYLTHYHPVENCRKQLTEIVKNNTELLQKSHNDTENSDLWNMTYQYRAEQKVVLPAARHMWSCLPGKYTEDDFAKRWDECTQEGESDSTGPYLPEYMRDWKLQEKGLKPALKAGHVAKKNLGTCNASKWSRTCSYWTSFHHIMALAEYKNKTRAGEVLTTLIPVIFGGATMCRG
eukprot:TRINITY_DN10157_c0_g1_i1.p1 TRINITY_DN10157_c0_g1~~TRINITY_DN10157_c0_g1_i1.p1  ORF type:complete len:349 (+),score=86.88 TRINITY_DN10157_c0_g1_i1:42-1088(+)